MVGEMMGHGSLVGILLQRRVLAVRQNERLQWLQMRRYGDFIERVATMLRAINLDLFGVTASFEREPSDRFFADPVGSLYCSMYAREGTKRRNRPTSGRRGPPQPVSCPRLSRLRRSYGKNTSDVKRWYAESSSGSSSLHDVQMEGVFIRTNVANRDGVSNVISSASSPVQPTLTRKPTEARNRRPTTVPTSWPEGCR